MTNLPRRHSDGYFEFIELLLIVVFGFILVTVPATIVAEGLASTQSMLLIAVMVLFVEAYIVLRTYHVALDRPYGLNWLGYDLVLVGLYVTVIRLLQDSAAQPGLFDNAMILGIIVFILLFLRQLDPFLATRKTGRRKLEEANITINELMIPMGADFLGVTACVVLLIANPLDDAAADSFDPWAAGAFALSLAYFGFKYLGGLTISRKR